jgi:Uma2 family endonuclease
VLSESTRIRDLGVKLTKYQEAGVTEYWAIDYRRQETSVWRREPAGYVRQALAHGRLDSAAVAGFSVVVDWLWQQPLPRVTPV